ncbi:MAG: MerR family transcriptional regulator [Actinomycetia bacterium]|nr:MerR family transcriptional regulator [Actinomycetes bacterium]
MLIGELSRHTGVSARSLRYYEQQELLASRRGLNGYRDYGPEAPGQVLRIKALLDLGLPTATIRDILPCEGTGPRAEACAGLEQRIAELRDRLAHQADELARTSRSLDTYLGENFTTAAG